MQQYKWLNCFDAILYINLNRSTERRASIESQLKDIAYSGEIIRIEAIEPTSYVDSEIDVQMSTNILTKILQNISRSNPEPYSITKSSKQTIIEACCSLSHAKALELCIELHHTKGFKNCLIIEDDAVFNPIASIKETISFIDDFEDMHRYALCQFGYLIFADSLSTKLVESGYSVDANVLNENFSEYRTGLLGTVGYSVQLNSQTISQLLLYIRELENASIADICMSEQQFTYKAFVNKKLIIPAPFSSTISADANYDYVKRAYEFDAFEQGLVFGASNFNSDHLVAKRSEFQGRRIYSIHKTQDSIKVDKILYYTTYDRMLRLISTCKFEALQKTDVYEAYVLIFDNLSMPNHGEKIYLKQ